MRILHASWAQQKSLGHDWKVVEEKNAFQFLCSPFHYILMCLRPHLYPLRDSVEMFQCTFPEVKLDRAIKITIPGIVL